jgi:shikimate kinase
MGTGKSTVGKILAKKLGWKFVDSDLKIQRHTDSKISAIMDQRGLRYFRKVESMIISDICKDKKQVVALGGGSVLSPSNRKKLISAGLLIQLDAKIPTLVGRLEQDQDRPLIRAKTSHERMMKIIRLYRKRQKHYKRAASERFSTDRLQPIEVATQIQKYMMGMV